MKIKTKISLGISFLFAAFIILGGFSLYFTMKISKQNQLIMKDNHLSLVYTDNMLQALNKLNNLKELSLPDPNIKLDKADVPVLLKVLEQNIRDEENNITEIGEKEQVQLLKENFNIYKGRLTFVALDSAKDKQEYFFTKILPEFTAIENIVLGISDLNMKAIVRKSEAASYTASQSYLVLSGIATICFLGFFLFIFGFPDYIANPIKQLTEAVKEISNKNFSTRVNFVTNDEFGEISNAFNTMAARLEEYDNSLEGLSLENKIRYEAALNNLKEAVIILDENQKITFTNSYAEKILGLNSAEICNKFAADVANINKQSELILKDSIGLGNNSNQIIILDYPGRNSRFIKEVKHITTSIKDVELLVTIGHIIYLKPDDSNIS